MSDQPNQSVSQPSSPREVDRIREIIFGSQMRDYERQFQVVQRDLARLQQELDRLNEQLGTQDREQDQKLQDLRRELRQSDSDLRDELRETTQKLTAEKVDRVALGDMFIELGNQLKTGGSLADMLNNLEQPE